MGLWGALLCVVLMTGCITGKRGGRKGGSGVRASFLKSDYAPLNAWLDESFEVEYRKMTLDLVFEQQPIADVRYEFRHVAKESPLFSLNSADISRRDILRKIALFYHLRISVAQINGKPAYVLVEGDARDSAFNPNETGTRSVPAMEL